MSQLKELLALLDTPSGKKAADLAWKVTKHLRWTPNPGPQTEAYFSPADELFYGGAAGGGKSDLLCGLALDCHRRALILRREGKDLRGIEQRLVEIIGTDEGYNKTRKEWVIERGHTIELDSCQHEMDKLGFQGRAHDLKAFDEVCQFSRSQYQYIIGWTRTTLKGQRCRVIAAGNPPQTPEGYWVKEEWAPWLDRSFPDPAQPGELRWYTTDPETGRAKWVSAEWRGIDEHGHEIAPRSRTFIPALLSDNPELPADYRAIIQSRPEPLRSQLLYGDFDAAERDQVNQVIPTAWIREAQDRWRADPPKPGARMVSIGVDMAQGGADDTVLAPRYEDWTIGEMKRYRGEETPDGPSAAALIVRMIRDGARPNIDMGGGYGQSTYDHLIDNGLKAERMNGAETSAARTASNLGFFNKRAEWWWGVREKLDPGGNPELKLPPDERLIADLAAPTWKLTPRGIQIEDKASLRKRLGRSPDAGDAVVMALALPTTDEVESERPPRRKRNVWAA